MRRRVTITPRNSATGVAALALALAIGGAAALVGHPLGAQTAVDPAQELKRIEADLAGGRSTKAQLDRLARDLGREIDRLRAEMAETASRKQRTEETVAEVEASLSELRRAAGEKRAALAGREMELGRLVGALQRLARRPPETLLLMGRPPLQAVRTGILLEASIPRVNAEAVLLKAELAALAQVEAEIRDQRARLDTATARLDVERGRLGALAAEKASLLSATESRAAGAADRLRTLADSARSLRELLSGLEIERARERDEQQRLATLVRPAEPPADIPVPAVPGAAAPDLPAAGPAAADAATTMIPLPTARPDRTADGATPEASASLLAMLPAAPPITSAKGQLFRPVAGSVTHRFGQRHPDGLRNRGLVLAARDGTTVVAPYDGSVIYAGTFDGFGLILIIEHGQGYHTLLAGLGRIGLLAGQRVLAGEPVGAMPSRRGGGGGDAPELYVELRHNGDPIDPLPWFSGLTGKAKG